jgi:arylsulfatase A-like enzyme
MTDISRRDVLKVVSVAPLALLAQPLARGSQAAAGGDAHNIIILVFDAWSAAHMQMYGYARQTMPNLEQFAQRAVVYHRHYSAGTFTVPGTASLLTGLHPWSHRALALAGEIAAKHREHQIFRHFSPTHFTLGYAQNEFADLLLAGVKRDLSQHISATRFNLHGDLTYTSPILQNDEQTAYAAFENDIFQHKVGPDASLFVGPLRRLMQWQADSALDAEYRTTYPRDLPAATDQFLLEDVVDGAIRLLGNLPAPSLVYLHFFPPHGEYRPKEEFNRSFEDGWQAIPKPVHPLIATVEPYSEQELERRKYDEYLASWDAEVARLLDFLGASGLLDSSYVIFTSDHGELFERGVIGHYCPLIYEPLVHVPLIISPPGRTARMDVEAATSSVDLLPTIASMAGLEAPAWAEGRLLPGFGGTPDESRSIYSMDAKTNSAFDSLTRLSLSLTKNHYRLTYYRHPDVNYEDLELYDLAEDPEELNNLWPAGSPLASPMKDELLQKLSEMNHESGE